MLDGVSTQKMCRDVVVSTPRTCRTSSLVLLLREYLSFRVAFGAVANDNVVMVTPRHSRGCDASKETTLL